MCAGPGDQEVPVLIVDVNEDEARLLLASHDEITTMAQIAADKYRALLSHLSPEDADLRRFVASRMPAAGDRMGPRETENQGPPEMDLIPHEHYDYVIVLARTIHEWNRLAELLGLSTVAGNQGRIGIGRAIKASKLIELLEKGRRVRRSKPYIEGLDRGDLAPEDIELLEDGNVPNRRVEPASGPEYEADSGPSA